MTTEETVLVRLNVVINPIKTDYTEEELNRKVKMTLANLFSHFSYILRDGHDDLDFTVDHEIELSSKTEHWDTTLVLKLIKVGNDD